MAVTGATEFIGRHVVAELERRTLSPILMCQPSIEILLHMHGEARAKAALAGALWQRMTGLEVLIP